MLPLLALPWAAAGSPQPNACTAAKRKAAGKDVRSQLQCHARASKSGGAADPDCLARAVAKLAAAFSKVDFSSVGPCAGTAAGAEPVIDACVAQIVGDTPDAGGCSAIKRTVAGKKALGKLVCQARSAAFVPACLAHAEARFSASFARAGQCAGTTAAVESDVDILCVAPIVTPPTTTSTSTTSTSTTSTTTSSSTSTTNTLPSGTDCCGAERIVLRSGPGTFKIGGFFPFPFPANATLTIDTGTPDATCRHDVVIPAGGFNLPPFCLPAVSYTAQFTANGCESGVADGAGVLWDGRSVLHGGAPETTVSKSADSSDGTCDLGADTCSNRDLNAIGNIDTTFGPGGDAGKVSTRFDMPAHFRMWQDYAGCPGDGTYNPAYGDTLIEEFDIMLGLTTGTASGQFADQNGDGCALPSGSGGFGPPSPQCGAGLLGPCSVTGTEALGPCCLGGQSATLVAVGISFSNGFPLYDLGLTMSVPVTVQSCEVPAGGSCVVTTDTCEM
jgi:hypothetical protein